MGTVWPLQTLTVISMMWTLTGGAGEGKKSAMERQKQKKELVQKYKTIISCQSRRFKIEITLLYASAFKVLGGKFRNELRCPTDRTRYFNKWKWPLISWENYQEKDSASDVITLHLSSFCYSYLSLIIIVSLWIN